MTREELLKALRKSNADQCAITLKVRDELALELFRKRAMVKVLIRAKDWMGVEVTDAGGYADFTETMLAIQDVISAGGG